MTFDERRRSEIDSALGMMQANAIPDGVNVDQVAEDAAQAAFKVIADRLSDATGQHTFGDFSPPEVFTIDAAFRHFVRAMAVNNPACVRTDLLATSPFARRDDERGSAPGGFLIPEIEACAPEELPTDSAVRWGFTGKQSGGSSGCALVWIWAETRGELLAFVASRWGVIDHDGEISGDADWLAWLMSEVAPADQPPGAIRTVLVHINASLPDGFTAEELAHDISASLDVVRDDGETDHPAPALYAASAITVALAEEIN